MKSIYNIFLRDPLFSKNKTDTKLLVFEEKEGRCLYYIYLFSVLPVSVEFILDVIQT